MKTERVWAMPSKDTFQIKPIAELLKRYGVGKNWLDPFAGNYSMAEVTNREDKLNEYERKKKYQRQ